MKHLVLGGPASGPARKYMFLRIVRSVLSGLIALAIANDLMAQVTNSTSTPNRYPSRQNFAPGVITSVVTRGDSLLELRTFDPNEEVQVIVQFVSPPLSSLHHTQGKHARVAAALSTLQSQIELDHNRFRSDLVRLEIGAPGRTSTGGFHKAPGSRVGAEYRKVFNGVALRSRRWLVDQLRALPYIRSITPDRPVQTLDSTSNHQIGADSVWGQYGLTGAGIRIGVLDTGIDYMHPDLGGGIGPGYKVAGGWSFVENVTAPIDDHGHGTHVAGIIAANGSSLQGVAPDATLYAIKVLSSGGSGYSSWIMAGLERTVDPDGDAATDDHLDIVNLSIGGPGDPTDPMSQAIDNTTATGVLCVVAAGNEGFSGQTIRSPGCASGALTVGACDSASSLASFSSRGPTSYLFTLKPDILAPGVDITSTFPGGTYETKSGTSIATPHATGAAALLKQLHTDFTPEMLKGALMGGAKDLGLDLWSQGKGRLDVLKAVRARTVASPQTLSFGLDDLTAAHWRQTDTVTVYNVLDTALTFTLGQFAGLPAGVSLSSDISAITVPAHGTGQLAVTLDVDNSIVQIPQEEFNDVTGSVTLVSPRDTLQIPWAVVIGPYIELQVTVPESSSPYDATFTPLSGGPPGTSYDFASTGGTTWHLRKLIPPDSYEVVVRILGWSKFGVAWIVRDSVNVDPVAFLPMSDSDALYRVGTALEDENGMALDSSYSLVWSSQLSSKRTGVQLYMMISGLTEPHWAMDRVSPLSPMYVFDYYYTTNFETPKVYTYAGQVSPVFADQVTDIKASDLVRREIEYRVPSDVPSLWSIWALPFGDGRTYFGNTDTPPLTAPFHQVWYAQGQPLGDFPWCGRLFNHRFWFDGSKDSLFDPRASMALLLTPNQAPGLDGVLRSSLFTTNTPVQESRGKKLIYGLGPRHYFGRMDNSVPTLLRVGTNTEGEVADPWFSPREPSLPLFLNQAMDAESVNLRLGLQDSTGQLIYQATSLYPNHVQFGSRSLEMNLPNAGRYTLRLWDPFSHVLSLNGAAIVYLTVDTRLRDPNPPAMTSFNIFGPDSEYTDMLLPGQAGRVEFRTLDAETGLRAVNLLYHTDSSRAWVSVPLSNEGDLYRAQLPAFTTRDGFISLRVLATDVSGNSMDYRAEPAVHVGPDYAYANRAPQPAQLLEPTPGGVLQLYEPGPPVIFSWHGALDYDGWDTLSYTFHIRGGGLGTSGDRWVRDTSVTLWLMGLVAPDEVYLWWVEATDGHIVVASDTATFRTSSNVLAGPREESDLPKEFALAQNFPNPFNPTTTIGYDLPRESRVSLTVYNMLGQEVIKLVDAEQRAGRYAVTVDGRGFASGVYIYRIQATSSASTGSGERNFVAVRKFMVLR